MWSTKRVSVNVWGVRGDDVYFEMLKNSESVDRMLSVKAAGQ
jgi:hypothetical protein